VLVDINVFTDLVQQLTTKPPNNECSFSIMSLFNKVLDSSEEDYHTLRPSVDHLAVWSKCFTRYFTDQCNLITGMSICVLIKY
jgi:hypothetical protein